MQFARDAGVILVACAGNGGLGNADVSTPGTSPLTMSIGATTDTDARASFSGTGSALDLVAPGLDLPTSVFNIAADEVTNFSGCSAATPVVAGIVTLMLSLDSSLSHDQVLDILRQTADDEVGPASEDTPGRDDFFGAGRVNMNAALQAVSTPRDTAIPVCELTAANAGPPATIEISIQDIDSGIDQINILEDDNASITIPSFTTGQTEMLTVTAEKIDQALTSQVLLEVVDVAGNRTTCDPVLALLTIPIGMSESSQTFTGLPPEEHWVTVQNQQPGVDTVEIQVNGNSPHLLSLADDETETIDVVDEMVTGDNTISVHVFGQAGTSALLIISDGIASPVEPIVPPLAQLSQGIQQSQVRRIAPTILWGVR